MPYRNPFGLVYDSGDYAAAQDRAVALADWAGFEARRAEARRRGRYRGIGVANYIEINTGAPRERDRRSRCAPTGGSTWCSARSPPGRATRRASPSSSSSGSASTSARYGSITGDTDLVPVGGGSHSGRSMRLGAVVMAKAVDQIVERGRRIAAWRLEAAEADVELARSRFRVRGTDRAIGLFEAAAAALGPGAPDAIAGPLRGVSDETMRVPSFPYGCAVCEVEVDAETGRGRGRPLHVASTTWGAPSTR